MSNAVVWAVGKMDALRILEFAKRKYKNSVSVDGDYEYFPIRVILQMSCNIEFPKNNFASKPYQIYKTITFIKCKNNEMIHFIK